MSYKEKFSTFIEVTALWHVTVPSVRYATGTMREFRKFIEPLQKFKHKVAYLRLDGYTFEMVGWSREEDEARFCQYYPDW